MLDVVGLGENSIDFVYRLPTFPVPNSHASKLRVTSHRVLPGGQVATTLATCAALGLRAKYIGVFGEDANGERIRETLARRGVDVRDAVTHAAANRYAVILVDERHGERVVLWDRDARLDLAVDELRLDTIRQARVLHVDDVDEEASIAAARAARDAGVIVTSDIDRVSGRTRELLDAVTIPIFSEHIPQALTGEADVERAMRTLGRDRHGWSCVTLGANGSMLLDGRRLHHVPAFGVEVVDSTGAGDVFRGAFIYAMLRGDRPADVLRFANAAAALSCRREGAIESIPSLPEVEQLLLRNDTSRH